MHQFKRILCATDFSEPSLGAVDFAAHWARRLKLPLAVAHVFDPSPLGPSPALPFPAWPTTAASKAIERAAKKKLDGLAETSLANIPHEPLLVAHPSASLGICDLARPDDLLIVGTHGRTGLERMVIGSVAEQVIRHAPCAVLAVRGTFDAKSFPSRMLICTDFSEGATTALEIGGAIARAFDTPTTLLHARSERSWRRDTEWADVDEDPELEAKLHAELDRLHGEHLPPPVQSAFVVAKNVPDAILKHAEREKVDLLVLATHGRTGLSRLVIGSVAERVTRHAHCPVLVVRTAARSEG